MMMSGITTIDRDNEDCSNQGHVIRLRLHAWRITASSEAEEDRRNLVQFLSAAAALFALSLSLSLSFSAPRGTADGNKEIPPCRACHSYPKMT